MASATITKRSVDAAKPGARDLFLWDDEVPGFGLKVTPAGGKVYVFQYRVVRPGDAKACPTKRYTIGRHGPYTPDQARSRAKALAKLVQEGVDPRQQEIEALAAKDEAKRIAAERARLEGELVFENVAKRWLAEYCLDHRPASFGQAKVAVNKYLLPKLRGKPLPYITKADLQAAIDAIPAARKASRQQVFAYASILFRWAVERGDITESPVVNMAKPKGSTPRDRVLTDTELAEIWQATGKLRDAFGAFYRLLILTGQRREEVAGMTWAELDRNTASWLIPANRSKNGVASIVPLSPQVIEQLDRLALAKQVKAKQKKPDAKTWPSAGPVLTTNGATPISGFSKTKKALDAEIANIRNELDAMAAWRVHDLRRTLATGLQRLGVRFEVTEAVLNHVSGAKGGVAGIYQRHDWREEKRTALESWARHVASILNPVGESNVVKLERKV